MFHEDGSVCNMCRTPLLTPQEWKEQRQTWISKQMAPAIDDTITSLPDSIEEQATVAEEKKEFALGFFIGALIFLLTLLGGYIIFADKFPF
jgi:hypothetical protein